MKIMHPLFSDPIVFQENRVQILVVENPAVFRAMMLDLIAQSEGRDGEFILSKSDHLLDCNDCLHAVYDYAHLEKFEKKTQSRWIASVLHTAQENMAKETYDLSLAIQQYLGKLATLVDSPMEYEESNNLAAILKAMDVHVNLEGLSFSEALYEHLSLHHRLLKNQCLVLIQARSILSKDELMKLYKMASYEKWNLLLLESTLHEKINEFEKYRLFDHDLCELILEE